MAFTQNAERNWDESFCNQFHQIECRLKMKDSFSRCSAGTTTVSNQEDVNMEFRHLVTVGVDDLDEMNHVNNLVYLKWCLTAATAHSRQVGWSSERYHESGFGFVVRAHKIKYKIPALLDDEIEVKTWVASMEKVSSARRYQILRKSDGKRLAEAETTWVFVDLKTLELAKIPSEVRRAFGAGE